MDAGQIWRRTLVIWTWLCCVWMVVPSDVGDGSDQDGPLWVAGDWGSDITSAVPCKQSGSRLHWRLCPNF